MLNKWYDDQPEPKRFLLCLFCIIIPTVVALNFYPPAGIAIGVTFAAIRLLKL